MSMEHLNWDNLRLFLAVVRGGSAQEAARRLQLDHSTVTRRLHRLESELAARLFERTPTGHALTEAGHGLLEHVEQMESSVVQLSEGLAGESHALTGLVRLGATEGFGSFFLSPHLGTFCERHPGIQVELLILPRFINLSQREADLAVNIERPQSSAQVCSKLCDYRLQLYGSQQYLAQHSPINHPRDLRHHRFVGYVEELVFSDELRNLASVVPDVPIQLRSTSVVAQYQLASAGKGLALLPCFMAAQNPNLQPVLRGVVEVQRTFWIAAPAERRELARVRALWEYLRGVVESEEALLQGIE